MPSREEMWTRLHGDFDLLVIGGGINGAGIARDASRRGLRVAVVEKDDLASGTSSRSSKLVHGGLRYLESYEFSLVFESVSERRILLDLAPHLVNPLGFLFPVYKGSRKNLSVIKAGMWLYDGLSLFRSPKRHKTYSAKAVREIEPALQHKGLRGAPLYYDCSTDDARLSLEVALDATHAGAIVLTHAEAYSFLHEEGRVVGARVRSRLDGSEKEVRAKVVINATGPWTDRVRQMSSPKQKRCFARPKACISSSSAKNSPSITPLSAFIQETIACSSPSLGVIEAMWARPTRILMAISTISTRRAKTSTISSKPRRSISPSIHSPRMM